MVAAAKLRRAQDAIISARPYARKMRELLQHFGTKADLTINPLFAYRQIENVAIIVVAADRGLCGAFNSNLMKTTETLIEQRYHELNKAGKLKLICVGKKGFDFFAKRNHKMVGKHIGIFGRLTFSRAQEIVGEVVQGFSKGEYDRVEVIYNEFKSIMHQRVTIEQFLPISTDQADIQSPHSPVRSMVDYIYEPSREAILASLVPKYLNFEMWRVLLESNAAEQGARMTAMDNATTNATDLIRDLQLSYNKARQASITKELLEIVSGAEALKNSS